MPELPFPADELKVALAGLGGLAVGSAFMDEDTPDGPAGRNADVLLDGIRDIQGADITRTDTVGDDYVIEFHLPDRDTEYPSAVSLDTETGRITEATIRLGPLGHQSELDRSQWQDFEGKWWDVVMDTAPPSVLDVLDGGNVDLGDKWVSDKARPHIRLHEKQSGYDITPKELVSFLQALPDRFERQFGRFADRLHGEHFREGR